MWLLKRLLARFIRRGELILTDHDGRRYHFGQAVPGRQPVRIRLLAPGTALRIARNPALGAGEAFMEGDLIMEEGEIIDLLDVVSFNFRWSPDDHGGALWKRSRLAVHLEQMNWKRRARRNVAHHYDLSDALYGLFLDADRQYSCAYFRDAHLTLEEAQLAKKAHIAAKLALGPGQRVLDIGCGWGGLALTLHQLAGVEVLGITLSERQLEVARARAREAGVADAVRFELADYRQVRGRFDRIVSVGMFEHVGRPFYRAFFDRCRALMTDDGVMLLHTIGRADGPGLTDPWTAKYIFPGGYAPALSEIVPELERSWLRITDVEVLRLHYARTIEHWYARARVARDEIVRLYDERFYRMWMFYLGASCTAFRYGNHVNFQLQVSRSERTLPITRDYMLEAEAAYLAKAGMVAGGIAARAPGGVAGGEPAAEAVAPAAAAVSGS